MAAAARKGGGPARAAAYDRAAYGAAYGVLPACDPVADAALSAASDLDDVVSPADLRHTAFDGVRDRVAYPWWGGGRCPLHHFRHCPHGGGPAVRPRGPRNGGALLGFAIALAALAALAALRVAAYGWPA